jgi:hypothetical protein
MAFLIEQGLRGDSIRPLMRMYDSNPVINLRPSVGLEITAGAQAKYSAQYAVPRLIVEPKTQQYAVIFLGDTAGVAQPGTGDGKPVCLNAYGKTLFWLPVDYVFLPTTPFPADHSPPQPRAFAFQDFDARGLRRNTMIAAQICHAAPDQIGMRFNAAFDRNDGHVHKSPEELLSVCIHKAKYYKGPATVATRNYLQEPASDAHPIHNKSPNISAKYPLET